MGSELTFLKDYSHISLLESRKICSIIQARDSESKN